MNLRDDLIHALIVGAVAALGALNVADMVPASAVGIATAVVAWAIHWLRGHDPAPQKATDAYNLGYQHGAEDAQDGRRWVLTGTGTWTWPDEDLGPAADSAPTPDVWARAHRIIADRRPGWGLLTDGTPPALVALGETVMLAAATADPDAGTVGVRLQG